MEDKRAILIYDVSLPKTYRKLTKILDCYCSARIQKSVFEVIESSSRLIELFNLLCSVVDKTTDRLALITLCSDDWSEAWTAGSQQSFKGVPDKILIL